MLDKILKINVNVRLFCLLIIIFASMFIIPNVPDEFTLIFILLPLGAVGFHIYTVSEGVKKSSNEIIDFNNNFIKNSGIVYDDYTFSDDGVSGIAISEKENKLYIFKRTELNKDYQIVKFNFNQVVESGIVEDGQTLTKTSKSGLVGGSLLGGAIAGGFGAVVGAMSANNTSTEQVKRLSLSIVVDNLMNPVHDIVFLVNTQQPYSKDNPLYKTAFDKCNLWHKRVSVIIKRNEKLNESV
ncbi:hypothetical protein CJ195_21895 [Bacillus sp. UMB0899]|uniref:hypothetical protein n=1 Tax=Metabacillus sp. YM-086 TaxID=3341729 RepID=UPI000C809F7B|nr:hypothetical protein CJ195_21895 [Bacillus sp. UMB0899]